MTSLHELDPTGRFSSRAEDYVKYRPSYPAAAIDAALSGLGELARLVAVDVGAGTGISSRLLASRGVRVIALEPNDAMRASADPTPGIEWRPGTAEATGLETAAGDLVLCAQAFHWFEPLAALAEFRRILRSSGRLALIWNRRSTEDALTVGYRRVIRDVGGEGIAERMPFEPGVVSARGLFTPVRTLTFPNAQRLNLDGLIGRARSASYVPKTGAAAERMVALLQELYAQHADAAGLVTIVYLTEVHLAEAI